MDEFLIEIIGQENFESLSSREYQKEHWRGLFVHLLNKLMIDEHCLMVNLYLNSEDRVVRVWKTDELVYNIQKNNELYNPKKVAKFLKRFYKDISVGNGVIKQNLVFLTTYFEDYESTILKNLQKLQDERKWTIVMLRYESHFTPVNWLPLHRNIQIVDQKDNGESFKV